MSAFAFSRPSEGLGLAARAKTTYPKHCHYSTREPCACGLTSAEHERPGRQPDMSPVGADLFRAALQDIWWTTYEILKKQ